MSKTIYEMELQELKPEDETQGTEKCRFSGLDFIYTAGHGYLVIPTESAYYSQAIDIWTNSRYGYTGNMAVYLEEDQEAPDFLKAIGKYPKAVA
jgi:hypothetical protein